MSKIYKKNLIIFIFIFIIAFFGSIPTAKAESSKIEGRCEWYTYQSFYDSISGNTINAATEEAEELGINKFSSNTYKLSLIIHDGIRVSLNAYNPSEHYEYSVSDSKLINGISNKSSQYYDLEKDRIICPKYVSFSFSEAAGIKYATIEDATRSQYLQYFDEQYKNILLNSTAENNLTVYYADIVGSSDIKPIYFSSNQADIENKKYKVLEELLENNDIYEMYGLSNDSSIEYKSEFYSKTKSIWDNKVNQIKTDKNFEYCSTGILGNGLSGVAEKIVTCGRIFSEKKSFAEWFSVVGTVVLETEGYSKFGDYFEFARTGVLSSEAIKEKLEILDLAEELEKLLENKEKVINNKCLILCYNNEINIDEIGCQNYSQEYGTCIEAYSSCKNVGSTLSFTDCLNNKISNELQTKINNSYFNYIKMIDVEIEKIKAKIRKNLNSIMNPSFDGINIDKIGYKVQCEDVKLLHVIYNVMRIIAPILVILFGTLDYTKSVLGADEKKILEARKKFPKRLILLILFILVPFIINVIVGTFGGETSLMKCIVSGS